MFVFYYSFFSDSKRILFDFFKLFGFFLEFFLVGEESIEIFGEIVCFVCFDIGVYCLENIIWKVEGEYVLF